MQAKTKPQEKNELEKIYEVQLSLLSLIIWGVHARYFERPAGLAKISYAGKKKKQKGQTTKQLLDDVTKYFDEKIKLVPGEVTSNPINPKDPNEVMLYIQSRNASVISDKAVNDLRTSCEYEQIHSSPDKKVPIKFPREHLELLCMYGHDQTYEQLQETINPCMIWAQEIRYIHAKLGMLFEPTVRNFLRGLQQVDGNCNSTAIKEWVCNMIDRETNHITEGLMLGYYPVNAEIYLAELITLMESCSSGFGVNISKWNKHWHEPAGKKILEINNSQAEGHNDIPAFRYIRIFLVEGTQEEIVNEEEKNIIKEHLDNNVKVYVIARKAWQELEASIKDFDFAVLRVGDSPMLLRSKFDGKTSGIFYTHREQAKKEFNGSLQKVLIKEKGNHIYMPTTSTKKKLVMGNPIGAAGITELNDQLLSIYTEKNFKS